MRLIHCYTERFTRVAIITLFLVLSAVPSKSFADATNGGAADDHVGVAPQATALQPRNILLMGVDARPGEAIDTGVRPDALGVLHLDPETGACRLLSIPRDTRVELPGYGLSKINHALAVGGIPFERLVVGQFLDIDIDNFALIDFNGVIELVDAIGGITLTMDEPFSIGAFSFSVGEQHLDGAATVTYARYRGGADGDFGRQRRQQQVLRAVMTQTAQSNVVTLIPALLPIVRDDFRTDMTAADLLATALNYRNICTQDTIEMLTLSGTVATFFDPIVQTPLSYVVVDQTEIEIKVRALIGD